MKRCTKCGIEFPFTAEYFRRDRSNKSGLGAVCWTCHRENNRKWAAENAEHLRLYRQQHREQRRENTRRRYAKNIERWREYWREEARRQAAKYPEKQTVKDRNKRARKRAAKGTHTVADIKTQYRRQKGYCYYCGCKMTKRHDKLNSATVDHVVPLDRGGRNSPDNLVIACKTCNSSKKNKLPHEWAKGNRLL